MKRCPECSRDYYDDTLLYCLEDGNALVQGSVPAPDEQKTVLMPANGSVAESRTAIFRAEGVTNAAKDNSIAVLPFANISADEENEYFCDGLAEELLNALAKIDELKVAARTSAFSFKGKNAEAREVGKSLGVNTVLEGSVRKAGRRIRINVQLVNAADGYQLWSERYDREMQDIFDVQDEITLAVVDALKVKLFGNEKAAILDHYTENTEAWQFYLKGRYHGNKFTLDGFHKALEHFNQAIALDPNFALAYAGMADAYYHAASVHLPPGDAFRALKTAAAKALELDDSLAEAHTFLALFTANYDRQLLAAEAGFKRGVELAPNNVVTRQNHGIYLMFMGRSDEAIAEILRAQNLDPLSPVISFILGWAYHYAHQPEKTLAEARRSLEIEPNFWLTHWVMALGHEQKGQYAEALTAVKTAQSLNDSSWIQPLLARIQAKLGNKDEAQKILNELTEKAKRQWVAPCLTATAYLSLGRREQAFAWLNKAFDEYDEWLQCIIADPAFAELRSEPRFQHLVGRMGFPVVH